MGKTSMHIFIKRSIKAEIMTKAKYIYHKSLCGAD